MVREISHCEHLYEHILRTNLKSLRAPFPNTFTNTTERKRRASPPAATGSHHDKGEGVRKGVGQGEGVSILIFIYFLICITIYLYMDIRGIIVFV